MMFGVVLWSDPQEQKAVIWCEDHGDLAFYRQPANGDEIALDAGDWIQFDMTMDRQMRLALNPRLVAEGAFPDIAINLPPIDVTGALSVSEPQRHRKSADIVPFRRPDAVGFKTLLEPAAHQA